MGEAKRRKLAGTFPDQTPRNRPSRAELIGLAFEALASGHDPTLSGVTIIPAGGGEPVYISAAEAKAGARPGGSRH